MLGLCRNRHVADLTNCDLRQYTFCFTEPKVRNFFGFKWLLC